MPLDFSFGAAILIGLFGSAHCIGMCSGIVGALNLGVLDPIRQQTKNMLVYQLAYNFGRITSYALIGALAGLLGAAIGRLNITSSPLPGELLAAAFMIALGLYLSNWWRGLALLEKLGFRVWKRIQPWGQRLFPIQHPLQALMLGALWGWLPCGLVYAVVAWSLSTAEPVQAALLMFGFGVGTLPSMLIAGATLGKYKSSSGIPLFQTLAGLVIIGFGLYNAISSLAGETHRHAASGQPQAMLLTWVPASVSRVSGCRISTSRRFTLSMPLS